jgi:RNA polymerase sigma factor (sigma-70 family)
MGRVSQEQSIRSTEASAAACPLVKRRPVTRMPTPGVLRGLTAKEIDLLRRRLEEPIEFVDNEFFTRDDAEATVMAAPATARPNRKRRASNDDSGCYQLEDPPPPRLDAEKHLFLRLNYCRRRVAKILDEVGPRRLTAETTRELLRWERATVETRGEIVRLNVPLVLAMAKRTRITGIDFADLISEGNLALLRSVDKFDCARGFKFSTYACRAILKSFSRVAGRTSRYRGHFPTEFDPTLEKGDFIEQRREGAEDECLEELKSILGGNLANLNDIEQQVIWARFALDGKPGADPAPRAKTLEQVGEMIGVTKERVRQIQNKALNKIRMVLEQSMLTE